MFDRSRGIVKDLLLVVIMLIAGISAGMGLRAWVWPEVSVLWSSLRGKPAANEQQPKASGSGQKIAFWKSSMIPNFVSPRPGMDPMGMALIPVHASELGQEKLLILSPSVEHNMGLRTDRVRRSSAVQPLRTVGQVVYAEPLLKDVTLKVSGWIEQLHADYLGQHVVEGEPLFQFYSPELITAQREYLLSFGEDSHGLKVLRSSVPGVGTELTAFEKLRFWDVPITQIEAVKRAGIPQKGTTFQSPATGWIIEKNAFRGMYMKAGTRFYQIADLSRVWVFVPIYEYQLPQIEVGQSARLTLPYLAGDVFTGKVLYIYPTVDPKTRQIRVRLEFPNPEMRLKPSMFADVEISAASRSKLLSVPLDAVIDSGRRKQVDGIESAVGFAYVKVGAGTFEAREVALGSEMVGGRLEILSGLEDGDEVVVDGQFQLDSERRVKAGNLKMLTAPHQSADDAKTSSKAVKRNEKRP
jgi:hypothetical protein